MNVFSQTQRYKALFWLSLFHLLVITSSNYLVQLPVSFLVSIPPGARLAFRLFSLLPT